MKNFQIPEAGLATLCRRYQVQQLALFGSALREDFGPASDIDLLVTFAQEATVGFLTLGRMRRELEALFNRSVDLVPRDGLKPCIRESVLASEAPIYAA
ncbi:MAG: nucleotidyltransferase family protein [Chloroflexota bacterium]|nr:nucleotidyltransferase family protein [Chloroflexota bacterium]